MSVATRHQNFVGGEWVDAAEGETMEVINPATGEAIAEVPRGSQEDVDRAVAAAKKAFEEWRETTPAERSGMLLALADALEEHADELIEAEKANVGKPQGIVVDEVPGSADNLRFFAGAARNLEGKAVGEYMRGYTSMVRREPVGVVGQIAPWNYPLMMAIWKIGPALAAGNTIVLKPSEQTPLSTILLARYAAEIFPAGVLNVITGDGEPVGAGIVRHPDVRMVSLTGDVATGKEVARAAADTLKRVHLELGGKAPVVVFDDADPAAVAEGITHRRLLELRAGLHGRLADHGRPEDLRPAARGARPGRRVAQGRRSRPRATTSTWARSSRRASRSACSASSSARRARRPASSRAARRTATAASSSSRPSSWTSTRRTRSSRRRSSGRS